MVFLRLASWSTSTVRCDFASDTAFAWAALARSASTLRSSADLAASSAARLASSAAAVSDLAAEAAFSAASKARLRFAEMASRVAACCRESPLPLTKVLSAGLSPPLRYRSPASCPTCLRVFACSASADEAFADASAAASRRISRVTSASPYALLACMAAAKLASWAAAASARIRSIRVTWSAVALSLALAAAISSGDGISGDAGAVSKGMVACRKRCGLGRQGEGSEEYDGGAQHSRFAAGSGQTHRLTSQQSGWNERGV